jgi:hypothetical protein
MLTGGPEPCYYGLLRINRSTDHRTDLPRESSYGFLPPVPAACCELDAELYSAPFGPEGHVPDRLLDYNG